jgi:hypothetical protein
MSFDSSFAIHSTKFIPVQIVASDSKGNETVIGDFNNGVVLKGLDLMDVASSTVVASFSIRSRMWVVKGNNWPYLFMQVKPRDE